MRELVVHLRVEYRGGRRTTSSNGHPDRIWLEVPVGTEPSDPGRDPPGVSVQGTAPKCDRQVRIYSWSSRNLSGCRPQRTTSSPPASPNGRTSPGRPARATDRRRHRRQPSRTRATARPCVPDGRAGKPRPDDAVLSEEARTTRSPHRAPAAAGLDHRPPRRHPRVRRGPIRLGRPRRAVDGEPAAGAVALPALGLMLSTGEPPTLPPPRRTSPASSSAAPARRPRHSRSPSPSAACSCEMGSAGAKAMAIVRGEADVYAHSGGQYEWDSARPSPSPWPPVCTDPPRRLTARLQRVDPYLPDLLICRPAHAAEVLAVTAETRPPARRLPLRSPRGNQQSMGPAVPPADVELLVLRTRPWIVPATNPWAEGATMCCARDPPPRPPLTARDLPPPAGSLWSAHPRPGARRLVAASTAVQVAPLPGPACRAGCVARPSDSDPPTSSWAKSSLAAKACSPPNWSRSSSGAVTRCPPSCSPRCAGHRGRPRSAPRGRLLVLRAHAARRRLDRPGALRHADHHGAAFTVKRWWSRCSDRRSAPGAPRPQGHGLAGAVPGGAHPDRRPRQPAGAGRALRRNHHRGARLPPRGRKHARRRAVFARARPARLSRPAPPRAVTRRVLVMERLRGSASTTSRACRRRVRHPRGGAPA